MGSRHSSFKDFSLVPAVKERIIFKILPITYKILHGFALAYLSELLFIINNNYTPHRLLRSSSLNLLSIPKTVAYGDRSISVFAPKQKVFFLTVFIVRLGK